MIDSSKKRNSLVGVEVLSPYVIERRSKVAYYSLWGSSDAFNNMITGAHCEGANNKCKVQTIIQDIGCMLFYHALA